MKTIRVRLKENSYPIVVGSGILKDLPRLVKGLKIGRDAVIITNPLVNRLHGKTVAKALKNAGFTVKIMEVEDSERAKSAAVAFDLVNKIIRYAADKKPFIVALGGGVVGDLAGFVASIMKRGVPFVQVPTTLLAQIDSAIGGKVAVDLPAGKNLVGAFYQPKLVLSDVALLETLSERQIQNGLAEAVKYGVIRDTKLFAFIEKNYKALLLCNSAAMMRVVLACAAIKAEVVAKDEKDVKGVRVILNFGHTVGHAIEAAASYDRYHHGEAVALGMRVAADMACALKLMKRLDAARLNCLLSAVGLPEKIEGVSLSRLMKAMSFDKKFSGKKNRFVLPLSIGRVIVKESIPQSVIHSAVVAIS